MELYFDRYDTIEAIKQLGLAWPFTHSESQLIPCGLKYTLSRIEGLKSNIKSGAISYGVIWHSVVENVLSKHLEEDRVLSYDELKICFEESYAEACVSLCEENPLIQSEDLDDIRKRIDLALPSWYRQWKLKIHPEYRVVAVEMALSRPIVDMAGKAYCPSMPCCLKETKEGAFLIPLSTSGLSPSCDFSIEGELKSQKSFYEIPFVKIGKVDCILQNRTDDSLWILDHKTSASPASYRTKLRFKTQLMAYGSLLRHSLKDKSHEIWKHLKGSPTIGGSIWDITTSKPYSPKYKSEKFVEVKRGLPPFAYVEENIGLDELSEQFISALKENDESRFIMEFVYFGDNEMNRIDMEDYETAQQIASLWQRAAGMPFRNIEMQNQIMKRYPLCEMYNSCQFDSNCGSNVHIADMLEERSKKLYWIAKSSSSFKKSEV